MEPHELTVWPDAIPGRTVALDYGKAYECPTCCAEKAGSGEDIGWIRCPMLSGRYICVGCCIDFNGMVRRHRMEEDPWFEDFVACSESVGRPLEELRRVCLEHQLEIIARKPPSQKEEYAVVRAHIVHLLSRP